MFEYKRVVDVDLLADFIIHGIYVGLIHCHALLCQRGSIVYRDVMEFRVVLPVFI